MAIDGTGSANVNECLRRQAEGSLVPHRELMEILFDHIPLLLVIWNPRLQSFILNRHAEILLGWTTEEANQGDFMSRVYPDAAYRCRVAVYMQSLTTGWREWVATTRSGERVPIDWANIRLTDDTRVGIGVDLRERKNAEDALRESEERFRLAARAARIGAYSRNFKTGENYWSPEFKAIYGLRPEDDLPLRKEVPAAIHPDDRKQFLAKIYARFDHRSQPEFSDEHRIVRPSGEIRWVMSRGRIYFDHKGQPSRTAGFIMDITQQKEAQQALEELTETLEQRVSERTQLAEARAVQLRSLAVELVEAEERERRRISGILHDDLQQLLASAKLQLEVARQSLPPSAELEQVERMLKDSISKSRHLSHELSPPVLHHSGLSAVMQWLARQMSEQFGLCVRLDIQAEDAIDDTSLKVFLFRAVQELLFNVVKHAGVSRAGVVILESGGQIVITISDEGRGFAPEILDSPAEKAGLGLLSLRERARSVGGTLRIDSAPGQGSRFVLSVPVSLAKAEASLPSAPAVEDRKPAPARTAPAEAEAGIRVLFVDDHQVMRQALIRMMEGNPGIEVVGEASNGWEAVDQVRQLSPDVVVMDVSMPKMDGISATRRIKAEMPEIRVIGLSMFRDDHIIQTMHEAGAEAFLNKTVSPAELLAAIYGRGAGDARGRIYSS